EPCLPAATVLELDVEVLAVESEHADQRQQLTREAGLAAPRRLRPAFAHPVAETQLAAVTHPNHRLGEILVYLQGIERPAEHFLAGHGRPRAERDLQVRGRVTG